MAVKRAAERFFKKPARTDKDELWPMVKDYFDMGLELRRPYEQIWTVSLSFLGGKQYVYYNQAIQLLQQLQQRKGRLRVVDNKLLPRYQKQVSRLIRNNPRMSVIPATSDQEDLKSAKLGDKVLKHFWRNAQMRKKIRQLAGWIYSCGNGFLDDRWNPNIGPTRMNEKGDLVYLGDADVGVWSPLEILVPASGINDIDLHMFPWMMKAKFRPIEWFGQFTRGEEVTPETRPMPYVDTTVLFGVPHTASGQDLEGAVCVELYIQPTKEWPKGQLITAANGIILRKQDYPFDHYNLEQFKDIEVPGVFWGMATIDAAKWLQKLWNRTLSDIAEYNRTMARGKWLIPRNAKMEVVPDDSHGQRLIYNPVMGHKPELLTIKGLPQSYNDILSLCLNSMMELFHQHEVTQGTNKSDIRSGEMVALLLEQDDFGNVPTHAVFEESLEAVMTRVLKRIQKGYGDDRVIQVVGRSNEPEVINFKGADLGNNTDVHVVKESSIPESKVARQFRIKESYKEGLYGNPQDERTRERVLKMLDEVPDDIQDIFKETYLDRQNAQSENRAMIAQPNVVFMVNQYDNHGVHIEEHNYFRKQPEYQKIKRENPKAFAMLEAVFMQHLKQHQDILAEQMRAQEERMARMKRLEKGGERG